MNYLVEFHSSLYVRKRYENYYFWTILMIVNYKLISLNLKLYENCNTLTFTIALEGCQKKKKLK